MRRLIIVCLLLSLPAFGCVPNTVRLVYAPLPEPVLPLAGAPTVAVVTFADKRPSPPIGRRDDGSDFMPSSNVCDWLTHALALELARLGLSVSMAQSEAQALSSDADFLVTGSLDSLWLTEKSSTEYDARMSATITVKAAQTSLSGLFTRNFSSALSRRVVPLAGVPQEMLSESLRELVQPMARAANEQIRR